MTRRATFAAAASALAGALPGPALALSCEVLQAQIEAKIRRAGVEAFALTVVAADAPAAGRVVGTCELGTKKIVYVRGTAPSAGATGTAAAHPSAPAASTAAASSAPRPRATSSRTGRPPPARVITECRDGTVVVGGDCPR